MSEVKASFYFFAYIYSDLDLREIWRDILKHVLRTKGPFGTVSDERLESLVSSAAKLYPSGLPRIGSIPRREYLVEGGLFEKFLSSVFTKSVPIPVASRWHTIETTCAYLLLLHRTGMLRFELTKATEMAFWPGLLSRGLNQMPNALT